MDQTEAERAALENFPDYSWHSAPPTILALIRDAFVRGWNARPADRVPVDKRTELVKLYRAAWQRVEAERDVARAQIAETLAYIDRGPQSVYMTGLRSILSGGWNARPAGRRAPDLMRVEEVLAEALNKRNGTWSASNAEAVRLTNALITAGVLGV